MLFALLPEGSAELVTFTWDSCLHDITIIIIAKIKSLSYCRHWNHDSVLLGNQNSGENSSSCLLNKWILCLFWQQMTETFTIIKPQRLSHSNLINWSSRRESQFYKAVQLMVTKTGLTCSLTSFIKGILFLTVWVVGKTKDNDTGWNNTEKKKEPFK